MCLENLLLLKKGEFKMKSKPFKTVATVEGCNNWEELTKREKPLYRRNKDIRSPFARDYTRILHSNAYRRLKHKTQVFFNIDNDHICTRMEHVAHVESVSTTIAKALGLNEELTRAIAIGHDLGHAPFGHQGESVIRELSNKYLKKDFWHEQNGLRFVDNIELLEDKQNNLQNWDLTYAVRDGIISHCGEIDQNGLKPRGELIELKDFISPGMYQPATWEGCVVKLSDKIAYVGRDIEDANRLGFINNEAELKLRRLANQTDDNVLNTTVIINDLITDVCANSTIDDGICLSEHFQNELQEIKNFNYEHIYKNPRFQAYVEYSKLVINSIFNALEKCYDKDNTFYKLDKYKKYYPTLVHSFKLWLAKYCSISVVPEENSEYNEEAIKSYADRIYKDLNEKELYYQAIIDYISGMTDRFAVKVFNELITY